MTTFVAWAGTSVGLAAIACMVVIAGWAALRIAGSPHATTLRDLLVALAVVSILVVTLRPGNVAHLASRWQLVRSRIC